MLSKLFNGINNVYFRTFFEEKGIKLPQKTMVFQNCMQDLALKKNILSCL